MRVSKLAILALLVLAFPTPTLAQTTKAGVVTTLRGTATVERQSATRAQPLKFRDDIFVGDRITTDAQSLVRILLGDKAVLTMQELSTLTTSEGPGTATIELDAGKILLALAKEKMKPGERLQVQTPNAVAAVVGTVLVTEVWRAGSCEADPAGSVTRFTVLAGVVDVVLRDPAMRASRPPLSLAARQTVAITGCSPSREPLLLAEDEAEAIMAGFRFELKQPPSLLLPQRPVPRPRP
jgi:hypothetical protein